MSTETTTTPTLDASALPPGQTYESYMASLTAGNKTAETSVETKTEATTEAPAKPTRPDYIPEKFWDAEKGETRLDALAKAHAELEKKFSQGEHKKQGLQITDQNVEKSDATTETPGEQVDFSKAYDEFQTALTTKEALEDGDYAALEKFIPRTVIDQQIEMQRELATARAELNQIKIGNYEAEIFASAGDADKYKSMVLWAQNNFAPDEIKQYDTLIADPATGKFAFESLKARYQAANPSEGNRVQAQPSTITGDVFNDQSEVTAAVRSKEYERSEAYRKQVGEKIERSMKAGTLKSRVNATTVY